MRGVHVVVPDGIDDPSLPSGGNVYDRQVCRGLARLGWAVREHPVPGPWPRPDAAAQAALARVLAEPADGAVVLLDGLIASAAPDVLVPESTRLRLVVLVHMPLGEAPPGDLPADAAGRERAVLAAAGAVVATSGWTRERLLDRYALPAARVHVAEPGVDPAPLAPGSRDGGDLLCVAAVTPGKGHDVLLGALADLVDQRWRCLCVGSLDRDRAHAVRVEALAAQDGLAGRVCFPGPRTGEALERTYASADLLVLASRAETFGMVVTEALARGLPVVATAVGGVPDALGRAADGTRPGLLVPPDDPGALAQALRDWLGDAALRARLREAAASRRGSLAGWPDTAARVADVLTEVGA